MVAPVTGPLISSESRLGSPNLYGYKPIVYYRIRHRYRQAKPYNLNLPYYMVTQTASCSSSDPSDYAEATYNPESDLGSLVAQAETKAYERFRDKAYNTASLGVTLAERKQAIGMMSDRILGLYRFSKSLRRGRFTQAWEDLNLAPPNKGWRPRSRHFGGMWLEYHLGWRPLVKDVLDVMEVLDSPLPYHPVEGSAKATRSTNIVVQHTDIPTNYTHWTLSTSLKYQCKYGAFVEIQNPNLHLASSLGLINPMVLAWELIPFSFVVDWFTGIGSWLQSFTDFVGCRIVNPWSLSLVKGIESDVYFGINKSFVQHPPPPQGDGGGHWLHQPRQRVVQRTYLRMQRGTSTPSLPRPSFTLPDRLSVTRGATAVSLLLQQLR